MERQGTLWRCDPRYGGCGYACSADELEPDRGCPFCGRGRPPGQAPAGRNPGAQGRPANSARAGDQRSLLVA